MAKRCGEIAGRARKDLETEIDGRVITSDNALDYEDINDKLKKI